MSKKDSFLKALKGWKEKPIPFGPGAGQTPYQLQGYAESGADWLTGKLQAPMERVGETLGGVLGPLIQRTSAGGSFLPQSSIAGQALKNLQGNIRTGDPKLQALLDPPKPAEHGIKAQRPWRDLFLTALDYVDPGTGPAPMPGGPSTAWMMGSFKKGGKLMTEKQLRRSFKSTNAGHYLGSRIRQLNELRTSARTPEQLAKVNGAIEDYVLAQRFLLMTPDENIPDLIGTSKEALIARNKFFNSEHMDRIRRSGMKQSDITRVNRVLMKSDLERTLSRGASQDMLRRKAQHGPGSTIGDERRMLRESAKELQERFEPGSRLRRQHLEVGGPTEGQHALVTIDPKLIQEQASVPLGITNEEGMAAYQSHFRKNLAAKGGFYVRPGTRDPLSTLTHEREHLAKQTATGQLERSDIKKLSGDIDLAETRLRAYGDDITKPRTLAEQQATFQHGPYEVMDPRSQSQYYQDWDSWYPEGQGPQQKLEYYDMGEVLDAPPDVPQRPIDPQEAMHLRRTRGTEFMVEPGKEKQAWSSKGGRESQLEETLAFRREDFISGDLGIDAENELLSGQVGPAAKLWQYWNRRNPVKHSWEGPWDRKMTDDLAERIRIAEEKAGKVLSIDDVGLLEQRLEDLLPTPLSEWVNSPGLAQKMRKR